jgi:CheY-like chemotaxis protein
MTSKVLIIDDDEDLRESVASILRVEGYEVAIACHGQEALAQLASARMPDLILLDLRMPVMDGPAFLRAVDGAEELADIPIVVFTSFAQESERTLMRPILQKPLNVNELIEAVAGFCERPSTWSEDEAPTERKPTFRN